MPGHANKVFGQLCNQVLGKPIAFPDASSPASTLLGYGRTAFVGYTRHGHSGGTSIVSGANLQNLALVLDGLRAVVRCLDRCFTADQQ